MKILATLTLILALAVSGLGYVVYEQAKDINTLYLGMSGIDQRVDMQGQVLMSHKKAILGLRTNQKESDKTLVALYLYLKALGEESSPKSESNAYVHSKDQLRIQ